MARHGGLIAGVCLAGYLALWALTGLGVAGPVDRAVQTWTVAHRVRGTSPLASLLALGEMGLLALVLIALWRDQRALVLRLGLLVVALASVVWLSKQAARLWPGGGLDNFPSGHTAGGGLLAILLLATLARLPLQSGPALVLLAAGVGVAGLFGIVSLYPMAHAPTEVLAGYLLAAAGACLALRWIAAAPPPRLPAPLTSLASP